MGSYISIGYISNDNKNAFIEKVISLFHESNKYFNIQIKYPVNENFNCWRVEKLEANTLMDGIDICYMNDAAELSMNYQGKQKNITDILIKIRKKQCRYSGCLVEIPEDNFTELKLDELEAKIIEVLKFAVENGFKYAYCDNETDIQYTFEELKNYDIQYSILVINQDGDIEEKYADWKIDGLTQRNKIKIKG